MCFFAGSILFAATTTTLPAWGQPGASQWTWMGGDSTSFPNELLGEYGSGPNAIPGARTRSVTWTDASGNYWLFSGNGYDGVGNNGLLNDLWRYNPQTRRWTWVSGTDRVNQQGVYGTRGVAAPANRPGGRQGAVGWTDAAGNLWLFGGQGYGTTTTLAFLNDLWRYNPLTNEWTWMTGVSINNPGGTYGTRGVPATTNTPGSRNFAVSWTDAAGNFWLFGGVSTARFNDLWRYNPSTNQWTWISGSNTNNQRGTYGTRGLPSAGNIPGARSEAVSWMDPLGNLWLMGGVAYDANGNLSFINDLWQYAPATDVWTWVSGNNLVNQAGVYGTKGTAAAANVPGARAGGVAWTDAAGLWLMGGRTSGYFNDVWRFNPQTGEWVWVSGANTLNQPPEYGTRSVPAPANIPGAREGMHLWTDATGIPHLFGGLGVNSRSTAAFLNDLWSYNPATNQWTWTGGTNVPFETGRYGTRGVADAGNMPGGRNGAISWTDDNNNFWLWGGNGFASLGNTGFLNDLWQYNATTGKWTWVSGSNLVNPGGVYGTRGVAGPNNIPGGRQSSATWRDAAGQVWIMGGVSTAYFNDLWRYNPGTNQWTWINGSNGGNPTGNYGTIEVPATTNIPGGRRAPAFWKDTLGNFWLLGGLGRNNTGQTGLLNDLWRYDPPTNLWTWMSGSAAISQASVYGTQGVAGSGKPGSREAATCWTDREGNFWLFGGTGFDGLGTQGLLNDLWKFQPATNQWTWVGGATVANRTGLYGTQGVAAATNFPGARQGALSWTDKYGNLWMMGGNGFGATGAADQLQDLWKYDPESNTWTWISGSETTFPSFDFGIAQTPSPFNQPPARNNSIGWMDSASNLWMMGGNMRYNNSNTFTQNNDLWRYTVPCEAKARFSINDTVQCFAGHSFAFSNTSSANARTLSYQWDFGDGTTSAAAQPVHQYAQPGTYTVRLRAITEFCSDEQVQTIRVVSPPATIAITGDLSFCEGSAVRLAAPRDQAYGYQWYRDDAVIPLATDSVFTATTTGVYRVEVRTSLPACSTLSAPVQVTVRPLPAAPAGTSPQTFCNTALVDALQATGNALQWYTAATGGAPLPANQLLADGTTYYASQVVNGCESRERLPVLVRITAPQEPAGDSVQFFCNSALLNNLQAAGSGIRWYASATGGTSLPGSTALANNTFYFASQTTDGCEGLPRLAVRAVIRSTPSPSGPADQSFCGAAVVGSLQVTGGGIRWYAAPTGGSPLATGTSLSSGAIYYASQTLEGCESANRLGVTVSITPLPAAPAGAASQSFCNMATVADLQATGTGLRWYPGAAATNELPVSTPLVSGQTYYATQTINGCEGAQRLAVTVTITQVPAPAGEPLQVFCQGATVAQLVASGSALRWYGTAAGTTELPPATVLVSGQTYYATQLLNGCESAERLGVRVALLITPAPAGAAAQSFCQSATVADLQAAGTDLRWYTTASGGTSLALSAPLVNGAAYYASQTREGCESGSRLAVSVTVTALPPAPTGTAAQSFCSPATVAQLLAAGTDIRWYAEPSGGTPLAVGTSLLNGTTYHASQRAGTCESASRLAVTVTVRPSPPRPLITVNGFDLISSSASGNQWFLNGLPLTGATDSIYRPKQSGTYSLQVTLNGCASPPADGVNYVLNRSLGFVRLAPNPVQEQLVVTWMLPDDRVLNARIVGSGGQVLRSYSNLRSGDRLPVGDLPPGPYWLHLLGADGSTRKVLPFIKGR
ncbi:MAG TPA: kelch repeat-containing protein [Lacibacter sp.]|nr:kelch repeat-containing protein [Lacibacter sp.]HMO88272.1 kelch repeat-containing protein [Lacibacter sp.]